MANQKINRIINTIKMFCIKYQHWEFYQYTYSWLSLILIFVMDHIKRGLFVYSKGLY